MRSLLILLGILIAATITVAILAPRLLYVAYPSGHRAAMHYAQEGLVIEGTYPEFGRPTVDAAIQALIDENVTQRAIADGKGHEHSVGAPDRVAIFYNVEYRTLRYAGVVFRVKVDSQDHSAEFVLARTLDLLSDRVLAPEDIAPGPRGILVLDAVVHDQLQDRGDIGPELVRTLIRPNANFFRNFIARRDDITFYFGPGVVASSELGTVKVTVPREPLNN